MELRRKSDNKFAFAKTLYGGLYERGNVIDGQTVGYITARLRNQRGDFVSVEPGQQLDPMQTNSSKRYGRGKSVTGASQTADNKYTAS